MGGAWQYIHLNFKYRVFSTNFGQKKKKKSLGVLKPVVLPLVRVNYAVVNGAVICFSFGPGHAKTCLIPYANNKGADQPVHPRSLISAFVVRSLDSIISLVLDPKFQDSSWSL